MTAVMAAADTSRSIKRSPLKISSDGGSYIKNSWPAMGPFGRTVMVGRLAGCFLSAIYVIVVRALTTTSCVVPAKDVS